jgi:hypothetical protein
MFVPLYSLCTQLTLQQGLEYEGNRQRRPRPVHLSSQARTREPPSLGQVPLRRYRPCDARVTIVYDTLTWQFPRASAIAFFLIVSATLAFEFINFSRFVFRVLWISFASTTALEASSKFITGRGIIRSVPPPLVPVPFSNRSVA